MFSQASEGVGRLWRADAVVRATVGREREVAVSAQALGYAVCVPLPDRQARPVDLVHPLDFAIVFIISYTTVQLYESNSNELIEFTGWSNLYVINNNINVGTYRISHFR